MDRAAGRIVPLTRTLNRTLTRTLTLTRTRTLTVTVTVTLTSRGGTPVIAGNLSAAVGWQQLKDHLVTLTSR